MGSLGLWFAAVLAVVLSCVAAEPGAAQSTGVSTTGTYVALGDSYTRGVGASDYEHGFVALYRNRAQASLGPLDIVPNNGGGSSGELLSYMRSDPALRDRLASADLVTVVIGYNDTIRARTDYKDGGCGGPGGRDCYRRAIRDFGANYAEILDRVLAAVPPGTPVRTTTVPYTDIRRDKVAYSYGSANDAEVHARFLGYQNHAIKRAAAARGVPVADVHLRFNGPRGVADPITGGLVSTSNRNHPNNAGYAEMARLLDRLGYRGGA